MKDLKKREDLADILRKAWLDRTAACQEAKSLLGQLEGMLREHEARLQQEVLRCGGALALKLVAWSEALPPPAYAPMRRYWQLS